MVFYVWRSERWPRGWRQRFAKPSYVCKGVSGVRIPLSPPVECGKVAEWLKAHPWKGCMRGTVSRVRISLFPPFLLPLLKWHKRKWRNSALKTRIWSMGSFVIKTHLRVKHFLWKFNTFQNVHTSMYSRSPIKNQAELGSNNYFGKFTYPSGEKLTIY